jgi:hypothetical protein
MLALTHIMREGYRKAMRTSKTLFVALLALALGAYAFDCGGMTTPQEAMRCCHAMSCSSRSHHGQDCCKTMTATHVPFLQAASAHVNPSANVLLAISAADPVPHESGATWQPVFRSHAPPFSPPQEIQQLRI